MAWCTNCSSPGLLVPHFPPKMCWICICIADPSKPFWQMKTASKIPTAGVRIRAFRQEFWQIISQWVWNLRLDLGQQLSPAQMRTTEFAPAFEASPTPAIELTPTSEPPPAIEPTPTPEPPPAIEPMPTPEVYGPPQWAQ